MERGMPKNDMFLDIQSQESSINQRPAQTHQKTGRHNCTAVEMTAVRLLMRVITSQ
jgi:hypothetical protein